MSKNAPRPLTGPPSGSEKMKASQCRLRYKILLRLSLTNSASCSRRDRSFLDNLLNDRFPAITCEPVDRVKRTGNGAAVARSRYQIARDPLMAEKTLRRDGRFNAKIMIQGDWLTSPKV
jgi:hypothetical protein